MRTAIAIIDRRALRRNLRRLRELAPSSKLIAVVKANSYGHGLLETAKTLHDADAFGVAHLDEALQLRKGGITRPILLLGGFLSSKDLPVIADQKLQTIVHNAEQLQALETSELSNPIVVWMKLDTGMHRLGIHLEHGEEFYRRLSRCKNIQHPVNILSHFSRADELGCNVTEEQINKFSAFCEGKPGFRSIAASSGILFWPKSHFDYIRPGIILYGVSPLRGKSFGKDFGFQPAMSFTSRLIAVREHKAGEPVSYGGTWISKQNTLLGVVAAGYGDGYPHSAPSGTPVLINNREVSIVGRVTMDMICVNLGQKTKDKIGDPVVLWGKNLPVERISQIIGVSAYELITRLTSRVTICFSN